MFVFDDAAAESVMSASAEWGVDHMFDLQHLSLDEEAPNYDPDARGWFKLDVRNGELWAVNITWTPDGVRRLTEKTQRYISPAFGHDEGRVTAILNVALCAMPATHKTPALVAASRSKKPMKLKDQILARLSIANTKIVKLAEDVAEGGESAPPPGKFAAVKDAAAKVAEMAGALDGITDVDEAMNAAAAALDACKALEAAISALTGAAAPAAEPAPAPEAVSADPSAESEKDKLTRLARAERAELIALRREKAKREEEEQVAKLAAEMSERASLDAELVKLGRETPASVKLLSSLSLGDLRKRVEMFRGAPVVLGGPRAPVGTGSDAGSKIFETSLGPVTLTANQLKECERAGAKPEALAESIAPRILSKKGN